MEQTGFTMRQEYAYDGLAAVLLIKTQDSMAAEVAEAVARINEEEPFDGGYMVWGVRWTAVVRQDARSDGIANVLASVRARDQEYLQWLIDEIREVDGVVNPTPLTLEGYFIALQGHNGFPY